MGKKTKKFWLLGIPAVIVLLCLYVWIGHSFLKTGTVTEIESRGYAAEEISRIAIDHSYLRRILGYNEWRIAVEFEKEPDVFFWFTYRNGGIQFEGVSSEPMMDKEAVMEYSEKFKNGTLLE